MNSQIVMKKIVHRRFFFGMLLCVSIVIFPLISYGLTPQEVPNPQQTHRGWVTDMANILSDTTKQQLNQEIGELEAKNGTEIAVVTVKTTKPSPTPKQFTTELFNYWGIGKKGINNGILFLVSIEDKRIEIETGNGIEKILPKAQVGKIITEKITPELKKGNFDQGILNGTKALIQIVNLDNKFDSSYPKTSSHIYLIYHIYLKQFFNNIRDMPIKGFLLILVLIFSFIANIFKKSTTPRDDSDSSYSSSDDSYSSYSDSSDDSGGFGGGDSDGGGDGGDYD